MTRWRLKSAAWALGAVLLGPGGCSGVAGEAEEVAADGASATPARGPMDPAFVAAMSAGIHRADGDAAVEVDSFLASVTLEALLGGTSGLTIAPRLGPEGTTQGYVLRGVSADSIFARVGLRDGDIIAAINGVGLTSPGRALASLQGARSQIVLGIERAEGPLLLEVRLVDGLAWSQTLALRGTRTAEDVRAPTVDRASLVVAVDDDALAAVGGSQPPVGRSEPVPKASTPSTATKGASKPIPAAKGASAPAKGGGGATSAGGSSGAGTASLCTSADACTVRRSEFNAALADPESAGTQANFVGNSRGYNLYSIKRGSTIARLGFQNGDLIRTINGYHLADTGEAMALYLSLQGSSTFRVAYERGGRSLIKMIKVV